MTLPNFAMALAVVLVSGFLLQLIAARRAAARRLTVVRAKYGRLQAWNDEDSSVGAQRWDLDGAGSAYALDAATWKDLDGDRLVGMLDVAGTALGVQRLHQRLRSGVLWTAQARMEKLVVAFREQPTLREQVALRLATAGRGVGAGFWPLVQPRFLPERAWFVVFPLLSLSMVGALLAAVLQPVWLLAALVIVILNLVARAAVARELPFVLGALRQVDPLLRVADDVGRLLAGDGHEPSTVKAARGRLAGVRRLTRWLGHDPSSSGDLISSLYEYLNLFFLLDANLLFLLGRALRRHAPALREVAEWIGDVDVAYVVASLRDVPGAWCMPQWSAHANGTEAMGRGVWHPAIAEPVANDVELAPRACLVITGANATGKSTYLRTVGVAALLAQCLGTCPAVEWRARPLVIRSLLKRQDDLATGRSYFMVEADRVAGMLHRAAEREPCLFLLDEVFRGTNRTERVSGAAAVAEALRGDEGGATGHVVLLATHDAELVDLLGAECTAWHFSERVEADAVVFEYARKPGRATSRAGLKLLRAAGAPEQVVERAVALAASLEEMASGRGTVADQ